MSSASISGPPISTVRTLAIAMAVCNPAAEAIELSTIVPIWRRDAGRLGDGVELQGVEDAAGLHQLDVHQIGRAQRHDSQHVARAVAAFVDHDRRAGLAANLGQTLHVPPDDRLLDVGRE